MGMGHAYTNTLGFSDCILRQALDGCQMVVSNVTKLVHITEWRLRSNDHVVHPRFRKNMTRIHPQGKVAPRMFFELARPNAQLIHFRDHFSSRPDLKVTFFNCVPEKSIFCSYPSHFQKIVPNSADFARKIMS